MTSFSVPLKTLEAKVLGCFNVNDLKGHLKQI